MPVAVSRVPDLLSALDKNYRRTLRHRVEIERGIPVPKPVRPEKYPFRELKVGESFLVDWEPKIVRVRYAAAMAAKRQKRKFATRQVEGGVRVWRIE